MLKSRKIRSKLENDDVLVSVLRGCLQGSVLYPLLWWWSLVVDELIKKLNDADTERKLYCGKAVEKTQNGKRGF